MMLESPREIHLNGVERPQDQCQVFFLVNGKTLCMMVNPSQDDVLSIKIRLADLVNNSHKNHQEHPSFVMASSKDMFLVWNGKPLDDDCVLADYNLNVNSNNMNCAPPTIFCHQRQRGGCFALSFSVFMVIVASILGSTLTCGASLVFVPFLLPLLLVLPFCCL